MLFVESTLPEVGLQVRTFDPDWMQTPERREVFFRMVIPEQIRETHAQKVCIVSTAWMVSRPVPGDIESTLHALRKVPPSRQPDRFEAVCFYSAELSGWSLAFAKIRRHPRKPPKLSPLEVMENAPMEGRIFEGMMSAFRNVVEIPTEDSFASG